ncbi:hypothetical protein FOA52_002031 [Chlamydomonas sp. UWO 241]|nr:hypothetical protein FOA52_002031 [Chlamydomonas sp. UWO 241]QCS40636.1 chloroplast Mg-protoporphyrin IX methyltransferase [Chlamydomonas sp. UWO 241]
MQSLRNKPCTSGATSRSAVQPRVVTARANRIVDGASLAAIVLASAPAVQAAEMMATTGSMDAGTMTVAVGGLGAVAGLGALLVATDPQRRRDGMMASTAGDEAESVKNYFNTTGFERWRKIYGETDEVNKVQMDIRKGHAITVEKTLAWLDDSGVSGVTVADCGCGTGSLAIPLALRGAAVSASDISAAMAGEAAERYFAAVKGNTPPATPPSFDALGLEEVSGKYDVVTCLDVMIHYPQDRVDAMISHLASLSDKRLIISFAPYTIALSALKRFGELFPGPSKATRAYLHAEADVEAALKRCGFKVVRKEMTSTSFYFSRLFEAVRE